MIATGNSGKVKEFQEMLQGTGHVEYVALASLAAVPEAPEETGDTFRANACLKAAYYARHARMWTLADDSGLEVDALGGSPGVKSARWAAVHEAGAGDAANNALLLKQLAQVPDDQRTARFVCVLALSDADGRIVLTVRDTVEGRILHQPRGNNGFGYDPLFLIESVGKTTAELPPEQKHAISHRGKALRQLRAQLAETHLLEQVDAANDA